ncbi:unnamed protein product [Prunus armeniaca]
MILIYEAPIVDQTTESQPFEHTTVLNTSSTTTCLKNSDSEPPPHAATASGGSGCYSDDGPTLESPVKTYTTTSATMSRATLIITSRSESKRKWLRPPIEVIDFIIHEPTSQCRRNFTATRIAPILPRLWSRDTHIVIYLDGVNHLH